jgi:hypothetical protein
VDRVLAERELTARERAFWDLVRATHHEDARESLVRRAAAELTPDEIYHATSVIALFNFYNKFVDLNGVDELSPAGYEASGVRLSTQGYAPPPR